MRGQSLNRAAILTTLNIIFRRPGLLVPHVSVPHLGDLDFLSLKASGVEYVVLDKDNTLTAPYDDDAPPHPLVAAAAKSAVDIFGAEKVVVLSNSAGSATEGSRLNSSIRPVATRARRRSRCPGRTPQSEAEAFCGSLAKRALIPALYPDAC